jgi:hypothetical protein
VVFVHTDSIEPAISGELKFIQVFVVRAIADLWVVEGRVNVDPHRSMLLWKIRWQLWVWHEVEENALHGGSLEAVVPNVNVALTALSRSLTR